MNYLQIAEESPEIICWAEASEVVLKRNAKTDSVGIKLDTFKVNIFWQSRKNMGPSFIFSHLLTSVGRPVLLFSSPCGQECCRPSANSS